MKKFLLFLLCTLLLLHGVLPTASAKDACYLIGDVDIDGMVSILDATRIQRSLAGCITFGRLSAYLADTDGDRKVTVMDATAIQRMIAGFKSGFHQDLLLSWNAGINAVTANTNPNAIPLGSEVIFTIDEAERPIPSVYDIYIDGIRQIEQSTNRTFCFRFDKTGSYRIAVAAYDPFGGSDICQLDVTVIQQPHQPPLIDCVRYDRSTAEITVIAHGGTAPYEYQYTIRNHISAPSPDENPPAYTAQFVLDRDEHGSWVLRCRFCGDDTVTVPDYMLSKTLSYYCEVQVRDADGLLSDIATVQIIL